MVGCHKRLWVLVVMLVALVSVSAEAQTYQVLAQQRADAALRVLTRATLMYSSGQGTVDDVGMWAQRWYQARRDTGLTGAPLIAAAQDWVDKLHAFEPVVTTRVQAGAAGAADSDKVAFYRLDAEAQLARLKTP